MVLIAGGIGATGDITSAELYNPVTGVFTPTASLNTARSAHAAALLDGGTVLIVGGAGITILSSTELY
jgi:hypothetical protein